MRLGYEFLLAITCIIPTMVGLYNYNKINSKYHWFIYMLAIDVIVEIVNYSFKLNTQLVKYTSLVTNLYILISFLFFLMFVYSNGFITKKVMNILLSFSLMIWLLNFTFEGTILKTFFYCLSFVSLVMLFIVIRILSKQVIITNQKLFNNFWFWYSALSVLCNAFTLLIFSLYFFSLFNTPNGRSIVFVHHFVNAFCYLCFVIAILKIPKESK